MHPSHNTAAAGYERGIKQVIRAAQWNPLPETIPSVSQDCSFVSSRKTSKVATVWPEFGGSARERLSGWARFRLIVSGFWLSACGITQTAQQAHAAEPRFLTAGRPTQYGAKDLRGVGFTSTRRSRQEPRRREWGAVNRSCITNPLRCSWWKDLASSSVPYHHSRAGCCVRVRLRRRAAVSSPV